MKSEHELVAYAAEHVDMDQLQYQRDRQLKRLAASPHELWIIGGSFLWIVAMFGLMVVGLRAFAHADMFFSIATMTITGLFSQVPLVSYGHYTNKRLRQIELPPARLELTTSLVTHDHYISLQTMAREGDVEVLLDEVMVTEDDMAAQAARAHVRDQAAVDSLNQWRQGDLALPSVNQTSLSDGNTLSIDRTVTDAILQVDNRTTPEPSKA